MQLINQKLKDEILENFKNIDIDPRVITYLDNVLQNQLSSNNSYIKAALIMLVTQLIIYFKAFDELLISGVVRENKTKQPTIQMLQQANDKILRLLNDIGISPLNEAKISKLKEKSNNKMDANDLLNNLCQI